MQIKALMLQKRHWKKLGIISLLVFMFFTLYYYHRKDNLFVNQFYYSPYGNVIFVKGKLNKHLGELKISISVDNQSLDEYYKYHAGYLDNKVLLHFKMDQALSIENENGLNKPISFEYDKVSSLTGISTFYFTFSQKSIEQIFGNRSQIKLKLNPQSDHQISLKLY